MRNQLKYLSFLSLLLVLGQILVIDSPLASVEETQMSNEEAPVNQAIDHKQFNPEHEKENYEKSPLSYSEDSFTYEKKASHKENTSLYHYDSPDDERYIPSLGLGFNYRYLGHLNKIGLEKSLWSQISAGLYYGRFYGAYYGSENGNGNDGIVPGLDHYSLEFNFYLNSQKKAFRNGPVIKLGAHYNQLASDVDVERLEVEGETVINQGENKWGPLLGASYFWQWKYVNLNVGAEYFVLGKLKSFVPLAISLGVAF